MLFDGVPELVNGAIAPDFESARAGFDSEVRGCAEVCGPEAKWDVKKNPVERRTAYATDDSRRIN